MLDDVANRIGQVHEKAGAKTVFGDPIQVNGRTLIPVARVSYGFGFGMGRGTDREKAGSGEGAGGGGGVSARPVAVLELSGQETRVKPIVDVTRLALAGMLLAAWNVFWITYTMRKTAGKR